MGRIESVSDLHSADAMYHQKCNINYRTGKNKVMQLTDASGLPKKKKKNPGGRPSEPYSVEAFLQTMDDFEKGGDEFITLDALTDKMTQRLGDDGSDGSAFTAKHMKRKNIEHFGDRIL
ncbi:hypothetical protein CAPTEDRAFT_199419 [Capitella teleta]|uniref:Uncharacterized protein n=1 Tax=Capitella teleta TaxID=283909 RepID=R7VDH3_CAPTE|nr:hypothetical protein CAPTEDRAFT_199419 [Capitella teleta]|eukprot:ELU16664.1 hypothetical protein CAPTEDRAFT_199419 [Capitella teleta]